MSTVTADLLAERLELAEALRLGRDVMLEPQDLPGRYGRVVKAVDRLLQIVGAQAVVGGGWAVWRHGYIGRVTQDVDIVLGADRIDEFLRVASVSGFEILPHSQGRWPKLVHKETGVTIDVLPEGGRPGTSTHPAPTTLPHPSQIGAAGPMLRYMTLPALIELKLAAGRARDESDVIELIRSNAEQEQSIREHLAGVDRSYVEAFERLAQRAREQLDH